MIHDLWALFGYIHAYLNNKIYVLYIKLLYKRYFSDKIFEILRPKIKEFGIKKLYCLKSLSWAYNTKQTLNCGVVGV